MVALAIKSVLNGIADPTFIVDLSGAVLCHNKAAREWLDAFAETRLADTAGPVPQDSLLQELLPTSKDKINRLLKTCATVSGLIPTSIVLPGNDNTRCRFVIHGNLMRLDENAPPGHIMLRLFRDQGVSSHRFCKAVSAHASRYRNQEIRTTVSIGVTESRGHKSLDAIYESADRALYTAKADGRARVVSAVESLQRTVSLSASYPEVKFLSVASGD